MKEIERDDIFSDLKYFEMKKDVISCQLKNS